MEAEQPYRAKYALDKLKRGCGSKESFAHLAFLAKKETH
jgi:hypothetical protein